MQFSLIFDLAIVLAFRLHVLGLISLLLFLLEFLKLRLYCLL